MEPSYPRKHGLFAKRSLGQNFLTDGNYIRKIVGAVSPQPTDNIIEIGPGRGALTESLIGSGAKVIAFELDRDLVPDLVEKFQGSQNFHLIEQNALEVDFLSLSEEHKCKFKLVANLPYYISTAILQHLIDTRDSFTSMVLMFQKEVVQRMIARPGSSERGFLSVLVEAFLTVSPLFDVPPSAFRPAPKVWSTVVRIEPLKPQTETDGLFKTLISEAFRHPRKTITNNLKSRYACIHDIFEYCNIDSTLRPEALTLEQWMCVTSELSALSAGNVKKRSTGSHHNH